MAVRIISKYRSSDRRIKARWRGRNLLNASVPAALEAFSGRPFFATWFRLKTGIATVRRSRK
jgi:hypothetical protein